MKFDISKKWCEAAAQAEAGQGVEAGAPPETWIGWKFDGQRLLDIATLIEGEAHTWADGFAVELDGELVWNEGAESVHVRHFKLMQAAEFLRAFAARQAKRQTTK